jgi:hypothetical protein
MYGPTHVFLGFPFPAARGTAPRRAAIRHRDIPHPAAVSLAGLLRSGWGWLESGWPMYQRFSIAGLVKVYIAMENHHV